MNRRILFLGLLMIPLAVIGSDRKLEVNLNRRWQFQIGDDAAWSAPDYDASKWDEIRVGRSWEDQGYPGYDGYAWYRISFYLDQSLADKALILYLGYIDDVDRVYINGVYLGGRGSFPPEYQTAYNVERFYILPHERLKFGEENVIAVKVYDDEIDGGIVGGRIGVYSENRLRLFQDFSGTWKFHIGDGMEWKEKDFDDSDWKKVNVPGTWSEYGYGDYDGYGWYRKTFTPNRNLEDQTLILALGKIDDIDEVYLNDVKIGRTGRFPGDKYWDRNRNYYNRDRFYYIRPDLIKWGKKNVVAVRVYDGWQVGGIYEGPIGLLTKDDYLKFKRRNVTSFGDWIGHFFDEWE